MLGQLGLVHETLNRLWFKNAVVGSSVDFFARPTCAEFVLDADVVKNSSDNKIYHVVDGLWMVVETR
jgi:hypothetical protein